MENNTHGIVSINPAKEGAEGYYFKISVLPASDPAGRFTDVIFTKAEAIKQLAITEDQFDTIVKASTAVFINPLMSSDVVLGKFSYTSLAYTLERNYHLDEWELAIISTSLSELEGSEESILEEYSYDTEEEALADIATLTEVTDCSFDKI